MPERRPFVAGNWKMNTDRVSAPALASAVADGLKGVGDAVDVAVCPPLVFLDAVVAALADAPQPPMVGAQDAYPGDTGAFTGEVSAGMLGRLGVKLAIIGHSERRHVLKESDELTRDKVRGVVDAGMHCILCIGETLEQREAGETDAVNERQLRSALEGLDAGVATSHLTIAYEPVWAIGTGKTATPDDAQAAHAAARKVLADVLGQSAADAIRIQYGGSMKPGNAAELVAQPDIDGGLIGGAALKADDFLAIVKAAAGA